MIALLDVNVLVALFDPSHCHHEAAHQWFAANRGGGWATCPITENGLVRVLSSPAYSGRRTTVADAAARLGQLCGSGDHTFWADSISIRDGSRLEPAWIGGHRAVTDVYLLALAVSQGGRLATFDRAVPVAAVRGASTTHLALLGA